MNDKDNTFIFKPEEDVKPHIERTATDTYSAARRGTQKRKEEKISPLSYVAIGLAVVLIITIIIGIIVLNSEGKKGGAGNTQPPIEDVEGGTVLPEDEEEPEEEEIINYYGLVFNDNRIFLLESGDGYAISADLYDNNGKKVETRRVKVTNETEIRDNGQRISLEAFISVVENQGGDKNLFGSEVREEDSVVLYIAYDSRTFEEDIPEGPETLPEEENEEPPVVVPETPQQPETPVEGEVEEVPEETPGI